MMAGSANSESAFLDVAANTLAIVLIMTMFSLLTWRRQTQLSTLPEAQHNTPLAFAEPRRDFLPPWNSYFIVVDDRIVRWELSTVVEAFLEAPEAFAGQTAQGTYRLRGEPLTPRDIDTFQLEFTFDREALLTSDAAAGEQAETALMTTLRRAYVASNTVPTFVVYASGMERFAAFYPRLKAAGLRFRWIALADGAPLRLFRHPSMFTLHIHRR